MLAFYTLLCSSTLLLEQFDSDSGLDLKFHNPTLPPPWLAWGL